MTLQINTATWLFFLGSVLLWLCSVTLVRGGRKRLFPEWRDVALSPFGLTWLAFGVLFISRFLTLAWDPVLFRASRLPLWLLPGKALAQTWLYLAIFWGALCVGMAIVVKTVPRRLPSFLTRLELLERPQNIPVLDLLAACTMAALLLPLFVTVPAVLRTPVGHFCSLWVIPLTLAWHRHFAGTRTGSRRFLYMVPGIVLFVLSPYREHLLSLFLCVALPAIQLKRGLRLPRVIALAAAMLVGSSILLYVYRPVRWQGEQWAYARKYADWQMWRHRPERAPWIRLSRRFHGFDSAALTIWLVPEVFPHEDRNLPAELVVSAFLPRALYAGKVHVQRGRLFSTGIWSYGERGETLDGPDAMIAPSMPGDLWAAGGVMMMGIGALCWGALIGLVECWRRGLSAAAGTALVVFLALRILGGLERDFVHSVSTLIQVTVVLLIVLALLPTAGAERPTTAAHRRRRLPVGAPRQSGKNGAGLAARQQTNHRRG